MRHAITCGALLAVATALWVPSRAAAADELDALIGGDDVATQQKTAPEALPGPSPDPDAAQSYDETIAITPLENEPPASTKARMHASRFIEEIVVTAQKREENLSDVPISISAFSADMLDARGIVNPLDLPLVTPGLVMGSQAGYTVTYLRGVGSDAYLLADPSVALYIDGIYFPFAHGQAQDLGAVERVEVLKGPQGTLFGRNAVGGAISVVTADPSFDEASGSVQVGYAEFDDLQTKAQVNVPLTDTLAIGMSGLYNAADNYRDGIAAGRPLPQEVTRGARLKLRWAPTDSLDFTVAGFHLDQSGVSTMYAVNVDPTPVFSLLIAPQDARSGEVDSPAYFDLENTVFYGKASFYTDWLDVRLLGSDQQLKTAALYDFDGSPTPLVSFEIPDQVADIQTAELQILSNDTSWAADRWSWIVGYYYFSGFAGLERIKFGVAPSLLGRVNELLAPILGPLGLPPLELDSPIAANGTLLTDSNSIFAQSTYAVTDWLSITLGARLQDEKRTLVQSGGAVALPGGDVPYTNFGGISDTTRNLSPKVAVELRPWGEGLVYVSYQQAVKSSTYNVVNFLRFVEPEPVQKEELTAYEIGLKKTLFDGTTTLSTAAFWYDLKNLQTQFLSLLSGGAVTFESAPAAEVKGVEFDIASVPFPHAAPGLAFTLGGAFVDARFTDYPDGQGFNELGIYNRGNDYSGKRIPRAPKFSGTAGLSQTFQLSSGDLEIAADYHYNSGFFYLAQNTDFDEEPAYGVLGARISYLHAPWNLRVTLLGRNLLDERYNYSRFTNDFGALDAAAPPRVLGLRMNWQF